MTLICAKGIKKSFSSPHPLEVIKGIDLELFANQSLAIVGKSGEGKSTLLHILGTLEKPSSGELELFGHPIDDSNLSELRNRSIGFIFQQAHLLEEESLLSNILMPAKIAGESVSKGSFYYQRALSLLEQVGLSDRLSYPTKLLSGGERQRAALARALLNDPPLILADEPSGNLDSLHSSAIHELLIDLVKKEGKSLVVVTHDRQFAQMCDRSLTLKDGILSHAP